MQPFGVRLAVVSLVVLIGFGPLAWMERESDALFLIEAPTGGEPAAAAERALASSAADDGASEDASHSADPAECLPKNTSGDSSAAAGKPSNPSAAGCNG